MPLDIKKLECVKSLGENTFKARCPACASEGADKGGNHLKIFSSGAYGCVIDSSNTHKKSIWVLAGGENVNVEDSIDLPINEAPKVKIDKYWDISILDRLIKDYSYWEKERGVSRDIIEPFQGGVALSGQMAYRFVFPIFDDADRIIGFNGRRIDGKKEKKWKILGPSGKFVWGGLDEIETTRRAILVESFGDAFKLMQSGVKDVMCLFGANLSQTLLGKLIALNPEQIIVSTNNDDEKLVGNHLVRPGQAAASRIEATLSLFFNPDKIIIKHPLAKDWGEETHENIISAFNG